MVPLNELTSESILSDEIFMEIFEQEDEIYKARLTLALEDRAVQLGVKSKFTKILNAFKKVEKATQQKKRQQASLVDNWTNFTGDYDNMMCGSWVASDSGIYTFNKDYSNEVIVCYHPILPVERMQNLQTREEYLKIAFKRNHSWREVIVPKDLVASASKIVALSKLGIAVTSENAKLLVKYLSDVENLNDDSIPVRRSTAKLGWVEKSFIPYDNDIVFDSGGSFREVYESIETHGDEAIWMEFTRKVRTTGSIEVLFSLAASFASILVGLLGAQPFILDLWGVTGGGKSVTMMLGASVWANPDKNQYIGDFKSTDVQLEVRADMLNHLPMMLDDTSQINEKLKNNFEDFVYKLCSGKGKSRSNKELGIQRECTWSNIIMTNGEHPMTSYVSQGGAINRILEVECREHIFDDVNETIEILKKNYGFAGKRFVEIVKNIGIDAIKDMQNEIKMQIFNEEKQQKQGVSLSLILTADRIITDYLFKDGQYIPLAKAMEVLTDPNELSENERCYQYLVNKIAMNPQRFEADSPVEQWGIIDHGYAIFFLTAFADLCADGKYSAKAFLPWADRNNLLQTDKGRLNKNKKINGNSCRCVFLKLPEDNYMEEFENIEQLDLPFK